MPNSQYSTMFDCDQIRAQTFVKQVRHYKSIDSTNNVALDRCRRHNIETPSLIIASEQTAGRGRRDKKWWSAPGALTLSLVVRPTEFGLDEDDWPRASLTTAFAVCSALNSLLPDDSWRLKWPNDVLLHDRKISGTLIEVGPKPAQMRVVGIGVNVNNSFQTAPAHVQSIATSLIDATGQTFELNGVLINVLNALKSQLLRLANKDAGLSDEWRKYCALTGRTIEIDTGSWNVTGACQGIDDDGALVISTDQGPRRIFAGTVTRC